MKMVRMMLALLFWGQTAHAGLVAGKWGLGAGIESGGGELSIIRTHSDRTAWAIDARLGYSDVSEPDDFTGVVLTKAHSVSVDMGPRVRRFARPGAERSPYVDAYVHGILRSLRYPLASTSNSRSRSYGVTIGLGLGVEYLTRWNFSVAAHTDFLQATYLRDHTARDSTAYSPALDAWATEFRAELAFSPRLLVRAYF